MQSEDLEDGIFVGEFYGEEQFVTAWQSGRVRQTWASFLTFLTVFDRFDRFDRCFSPAHTTTHTPSNLRRFRADWTPIGACNSGAVSNSGDVSNSRLQGPALRSRRGRRDRGRRCRNPAVLDAQHGRGGKISWTWAHNDQILARISRGYTAPHMPCMLLGVS